MGAAWLEAVSSGARYQKHVVRFVDLPFGCSRPDRLECLHRIRPPHWRCIRTGNVGLLRQLHHGNAVRAQKSGTGRSDVPLDFGHSHHTSGGCLSDGKRFPSANPVRRIGSPRIGAARPCRRARSSCLCAWPSDRRFFGPCHLS